jgi:hypothetical protein
MNSLKYAFDILSNKFLEFIIHEHDKEIDQRMKPIKKVKAPVHKKKSAKFSWHGELTALW